MHTRLGKEQVKKPVRPKEIYVECLRNQSKMPLNYLLSLKTHGRVRPQDTLLSRRGKYNLFEITLNWGYNCCKAILREAISGFTVILGGHIKWSCEGICFRADSSIFSLTMWRSKQRMHLYNLQMTLNQECFKLFAGQDQTSKLPS